MASETVDPIDWSSLPPQWAVPLERLVHSINRCSLSRESTLQPSALLLSLLKPATQAQVWKTKLFINCFHNPQAPALRRTEENTTQGSNQRLTTTLIEPIQCSDVKHCGGKGIPHSILRRQEKTSKLGRLTPWYFTLTHWSVSLSHSHTVSV